MRLIEGELIAVEDLNLTFDAAEADGADIAFRCGLLLRLIGGRRRGRILAILRASDAHSQKDGDNDSGQ
jgi:hypothetical protein